MIVNNLTPQMQQRLDKWKKGALEIPSASRVRGNQVMRPINGDKGDVDTVEQWEEEKRKSQTRK
jgi:hypothetical protein